MGLFFSTSDGYISRSTWDAVDALASTALHHPVSAVVITAVESLTTVKELFYSDDCMRFLRELQKIQMFDEGFPDVAYNFYVGGDGSVYEGRGWYAAPSLNKEEHQENTEALAIAYIKPIRGGKPTKEMVTKVEGVINDGVKKGYIDKNYIMKGLLDGLDST